jgi:predicted dinucleotide-binding enzyme
MDYPSDRIPSEAEKQALLQMLLLVSGDHAGAIQYLSEHVKRTVGPDAVHVGVRRLSTFSYLILTLSAVTVSMPQERHSMQ